MYFFYPVTSLNLNICGINLEVNTHLITLRIWIVFVSISSLSFLNLVVCFCYSSMVYVTFYLQKTNKQCNLIMFYFLIITVIHKIMIYQYTVKWFVWGYWISMRILNICYIATVFVISFNKHRSSLYICIYKNVYQLHKTKKRCILCPSPA